MRTIPLTLVAAVALCLPTASASAKDVPQNAHCVAAGGVGRWLVFGVLTADDDKTSAALDGSGTLACMLVDNGLGHLGSGETVTGFGTGVITAGPALKTLDSENVVVCTQFVADSDGTTYYYDESTIGMDPWKTDPDEAACAELSF